MHQAKTYSETVDPLTVSTFRALVEAIVPRTPELAVFGELQTIGAVDLHVHEYMIWEMDHTLALMIGISLTAIPLAAPTAQLLNSGAMQFVAAGAATAAPNNQVWAVSPFAALSTADRIRVLAMLEQRQVDFGLLPPPYKDDAGLVVFIVDYLNRGTMFGNYSEWSAYGTTRLNTPTQRRLEYFPISWRQVGYPGVSSGYRAFRGYVLFIVREGGEYTIV